MSNEEESEDLHVAIRYAVDRIGTHDADTFHNCSFMVEGHIRDGADVNYIDPDTGLTASELLAELKENVMSRFELLEKLLNKINKERRNE